MTRLIRFCIAIVLAALASSCVTPQMKSVRGRKKVKIFLLSGQSNMTGRGMLGWEEVPLEKQKHTLYNFVRKPENVEKYAYLTNGTSRTENGWTIRDDVFITMGQWPHLEQGDEGYSAYNRHGGLGPYYGGRGNRGFGPELAIGHILGNHYDETVVLVKVSFGGNSLAKHFRPPSSGGELGVRYPLVIKAVRDALEHLPEIVPGYSSRDGYELIGFFWNQGLSDGGPEYSKEYEANMANLIKDLRKDLNAPQMKTVIGITGNWGWDFKDLIANHASYRETHPDFPPEKTPEKIEGLKRVQKAQIDVSKRPEFEGTVATAETRDFWRTRAEFGGHGTEEHWMANGESYWLIGESMANEMVKLLNQSEGKR